MEEFLDLLTTHELKGLPAEYLVRPDWQTWRGEDSRYLISLFAGLDSEEHTLVKTQILADLIDRNILLGPGQ